MQIRILSNRPLLLNLPDFDLLPFLDHLVQISLRLLNVNAICQIQEHYRSGEDSTYTTAIRTSAANKSGISLSLFIVEEFFECRGEKFA